MSLRKLTEDEMEKALSAALEGNSVKRIGEILGLTQREFYKIRGRDPLFEKRFSHAREEGVHNIVDSLLDISDNCESILDINVARLKSENVKWIASRRLPEKYGDRLDVNVNQTVDISTILEAAAKRVLPLLDKPQDKLTEVIDVDPVSMDDLLK